MDIIHCLDDNYVPMCATAIVSLCENNKGVAINYHIISSNLSDENKKDLREVIARFDHCVNFYDVDASLLSGCVVREGDHVSVAAYLRILIPRILPTHISTALYLDCDLVVCGDISELFDMDLSEYACAAVYDGSVDDIRNYNRLCYPREMGYFNSGVLLFNLDYWRKKDVTTQIFDYISKNPEKLLFWDQDAINATLVGKIKHLPFKYNMTDPFYQKNLPIRQKFLDEIKTYQNSPVILHFATADKPWLKKNAAHPLKDIFYRYLSETKWSRCFPSQRTSIKSRILRLIEKSGYTIQRPRSNNYLISSELHREGGGN